MTAFEFCSLLLCLTTTLDMPSPLDTSWSHNTHICDRSSSQLNVILPFTHVNDHSENLCARATQKNVMSQEV